MSDGRSQADENSTAASSRTDAIRDPARVSLPGNGEDAIDTRRRLEDLTRLVSDWVWETDHDLRLTFVSERAFEMLGWLPVQLQGRRLTDLGHFMEGGEDALRNNPEKPFRDLLFEAVTSDDQRRQLLLSGLPYYHPENGEFLGVRGTARDVTELRAAEEARAMEEERRRIFVADVAHELRTPLAVLKANLDGLSSETAIAALREDVDAMTRMISQLLTFTRFEFFELTSEDRADLREVCTTVVTHLAPLVIREDKSIEVVGGASKVIVHGKPEALEHAVRNLLENAVRHTPRNSTVTVRITEAPAVHILDQGPGIPENRRDEIFELFRRADRRGGAAGLGLAIVRRIADVHQAAIKIRDRPGGGADFCLEFPRP